MSNKVLHTHKYVHPETEEVKTVELDARSLLYYTIDVYRMLSFCDTSIGMEDYDMHESMKAAIKYLIHIQWKTKNNMLRERRRLHGESM